MPGANSLITRGEGGDRTLSHHIRFHPVAVTSAKLVASARRPLV